MHALPVTETDFLFLAAGGAVGCIGREIALELAEQASPPGSLHSALQLHEQGCDVVL